MCVFAKWSAYEVSVKMKWLTVLQLISGHWSCDSLGLGSAVGEKGKKPPPLFPSQTTSRIFFFANPDYFAWSQASLVITFLEPQAPLWTLSDWATSTVLAFSSLCSFARVSPLETACRLSKKSFYQANKEGDNMVPHEDTSIRRPVPIADT